MSAGVGIAGAIIAAASHIAGNLQDGADDISVSYPDPNPVEKKIANFQLESARSLREKIDDPRILQTIYQQLPDTKMSAEDRAAFTEEYAQIKQRVAAMSAEQSNRAMGEELDSLVSRGVLSQEAADKQRIKNEAAVNAVLKIYNKKLDAARIGMARGQYLRDSELGIKNASAINEVDQRNRQIYNGVIQQALQNMERRQNVESYIDNKVADANTGNFMFNADTLYDFNSSIMQQMIPYGSGQDSGSGGGGGMNMGSFMNMFGGSSGGGGGPQFSGGGARPGGY